MDTLEIDKKVSAPDFLGAFSFDELPTKPKNGTFTAILNVDSSNLPGSHWIAIIYKNSCFYFIDSYGRHFNDGTFPKAFSTTIKNYFGKNCYKTNTKMFQQLTSNACGDYCIYFIQEMTKKSFKNVLSVFSANLAKNDTFVTEYVKKL